MSEREKDLEILALRHQLLVLQRQVGKPAFTDTDRAALAGLLHGLPRDRLRELLPLVSPDTILRRHRDLLKRRHAATCVPRRRGRPPTIRSIRAVVLRRARENPSWDYHRINGERAALGIKVAASTVWEILREHGIPPAPERESTTWADFLRSQAQVLLACDLFETRTRPRRRRLPRGSGDYGEQPRQGHSSGGRREPDAQPGRRVGNRDPSTRRHQMVLDHRAGHLAAE